MLNRLKLLTTPVLAIVLVVTGFAFQVSAALAQGAAGQTIAHIEHVISCNDAGNPICEGETGGGSFTFKIYADGTGTIAGAFGGHTIGGVGGPGGAGAISVHQEISWSLCELTEIDTCEDAEQFGVDPNGWYYLVTIDVGGEVEKGLFPTTVGHYSTHLAPGVAEELQVSP